MPTFCILYTWSVKRGLVLYQENVKDVLKGLITVASFSMLAVNCAASGRES